MLVLYISFATYTVASEYVVPRKPVSADFADIDLDGDLDIVISHKVLVGYDTPSITILENINGTFDIHNNIPSFPGGGPEIKLIDLDKDGYKDLIVFTLDYSNGIIARILRIFKNQNGTFSEFSDVDLNTDARIDDMSIFYDSLGAHIAYISNQDFYLGILRNDGLGNFAAPEYYYHDFPPNGVACGDLNGNKRDDIVVGNYNKMPTIYYNQLEGLTLSIQDSLQGEPQIADINNDGKNEIITSIWGMPGVKKRIYIYEKNDSSGNYNLIYEKWIDEALAEFELSDLNNDSYPEIIYNVSYSYPNSDEELFRTYILYNNGDNTFSDPVSYFTGICSHKSYIADLDGNGFNDILTLNWDFYNPPPDTGTIHILFNDGTGNFVEDPITSIDDREEVFNEYILFQNYPNPFNPSTNIKYQLQKTEHVKLVVYDVLGRAIKVLVNEYKTAGVYQTKFNGAELVSGIYFYKLQSGDFTETKKLLLLK